MCNTCQMTAFVEIDGRRELYNNFFFFFKSLDKCMSFLSNFEGGIHASPPEF